ncbi:MAG: site-specific integrase, partial [Parvibaculales bacterium]
MSGAKDGSKDASDDRNLDLFLDMMAAERGASANTLAAYRRDLQQVAAFLDQKGESLSAASAKNLQAYMVRLNKRDMAASTAARHLSSQ